MYVYGPAWLGSWEGQSTLDICSGLTKVDSAHWALLPDVCKDLIDRKVHATLIGIGSLSALVLVWTCLQTCVNASTYILVSKLSKQSLHGR